MNPELDPTPYAEREGYVPPPLAPEEELVTERLAAIPGDLVSDDLRSELLRAAQAQALHREVQEAITAAEMSTREALAVPHIVDAAREAGRATDLALLVPFLPNPALDGSIIADSKAKAVAHVRAAQLTVATLPELAFTLELAAWRSLGPNSMSLTPPPISLVSDIEAEKAYVAFVGTRARVTQTVAAFHTNQPQMDVLNALSSAQGIADMIAKHVSDVTELAKTISAANAARKKAGINWIAPTGISTPELVAMAKA